MGDYYCPDCGAYVTDDVWPGPGLEKIQAHLRVCPAIHTRSDEEIAESINAVHWKRLDNGTYLVCVTGHDIDENHWHVAPDGTVLSVKEGGNYIYNRRQVRKNIRDITGIDLPLRWQKS